MISPTLGGEGIDIDRCIITGEKDTRRAVVLLVLGVTPSHFGANLGGRRNAPSCGKLFINISMPCIHAAKIKNSWLDYNAPQNPQRFMMKAVRVCYEHQQLSQLHNEYALFSVVASCDFSAVNNLLDIRMNLISGVAHPLAKKTDNANSQLINALMNQHGTLIGLQTMLCKKPIQFPRCNFLHFRAGTVHV